MAEKNPSPEGNLRFFDAERILMPPQNAGLLGGGSYGKVYKCFEPAHRIVAVKVMGADLNSLTSSLRQKAVEEANIALQANHENIVRLYGIINMEKSVGLVMEFMLCGTMLSLLEKKEVDLPWAFRLRVCLEISSGLAFLHGMVVNGRNIVHGDFKPENVLLDKDCHAKIADFGSSTLAFVTSTMRNVSPSAQAFTPAYCAPEIMSDPFYKVKSSSDIFSYGMTMYHVIFREYPISNANIPFNVYKDALLHGVRPPLDDLDDLRKKATGQDKVFIGHLVGVMKECWQTKPVDRPQSASVREKHLAAFTKASEEVVARSVQSIKRTVGGTQHHDVDVTSWVSLASVFGKSREERKVGNAGDKQLVQTTEPSAESDADADLSDVGDVLHKLLLGMVLGDLLQAGGEKYEEWEEFMQRLVPLENHLLAERKTIFQVQFKALQEFVKSSNKPKAGNIIYSTAESLLEKKKYYQAALASALVSRTFLDDSNVSKQNLHMIESCACNIQTAVEELKKSGNTINSLSKQLFPSIIESIISDLCKIGGDKEFRITNLGWCCKYLSAVCDLLGMEQDSRSAIDRGIKFMDNNLGEQKASNYRIYGLLHHFKGKSLEESHDFAEAKKYYIFAEKCFKNADDFRSTRDKQVIISKNTNAYNQAQRKEMLLKLTKDECSVM